MNLWTAAKMIGGGNPRRGLQSIRDIAVGCKEIRKNSPVFAEGEYHALGIIGEKFRELEQAVEKDTPKQQKEKALHIAVAAIRFMQDEHNV